MRKKIIHIAPSDGNKTGIATYADLIDSAFKKYRNEQVEIIRLHPSNQIDCNFDKDDVLLCEIGINDGDIYRWLSRKCPSYIQKRVITIHDPPKIVNCPINAFEHLNYNKVLRAFRRVLNNTFSNYFLKSFIRKNDHFVCLTKSGSEILRQRLNHINQSSIGVSFIPILNYLDPCPQSTLSRSSSLTIGLFGFLSPDKGLHFLVDAAIKIKECYGITFVPNIEIHGKAVNKEAEQYVNRLQNSITNAGLQEFIKINGFISNNKLPDFIQSVDIIALPYVKNTTFAASGPAQWARTFGKPLLASNTSIGISSVNDKVDGFIVNNSVDDWAETICRLSKDKKCLDTLKAGSMVRQKASEWKTVTSEFLNLFY